MRYEKVKKTFRDYEMLVPIGTAMKTSQPSVGKDTPITDYRLQLF